MYTRSLKNDDNTPVLKIKNCHKKQTNNEINSINSSYLDMAKNKGVISEWVYSPQQPTFTLLMLPLLQQLGMQSRWLLWLSPSQKLNRHWLQQMGLPMDKMVHLNQVSPESAVDIMEKALASGNYSGVLGWLPELTETDQLRLSRAANQGNAYGFIMRPAEDLPRAMRHPTQLKVHSEHYH